MSEFQAATAAFGVIGNNTTIDNFTEVYADVGGVTSMTVQNDAVVVSPAIEHPVNDLSTQNAVADINSVYDALMARTTTSNTTGKAFGDLNITTIPYLEPGVYSMSGLCLFTASTFTLSAANLNDQFVIKVGSNPAPGVDNRVLFDDNGTIRYENNARPENVYIVTENNVEIGNVTSASMNIISKTANITANPIGTFLVRGRLFSTGGNVNLNYGIVTLPASFCYGKGSKVLTDTGYVPIEELKIGVMIATHGKIKDRKRVKTDIVYKPLQFVGKTSYQVFSPFTQPIVFKKESMGPNLPIEDLLVSPNHGMIIDDQIVGAECLLKGDSIVRHPCEKIEYYVVQLDDHYAIDVNGLMSETLLGNSSSFDAI